MNNELLHEFRNKVNEGDMILHIFRNKNNRNQWSILCSAMDWIEVALEGIDISLLSRENDNRSSIKMITFISCIDILWESIQQIHRVLLNTRRIPFNDDKSIFNQEVSDNIYFKTIRACFAAHPVNLQDVFPDDDDNERWFASWSGGTFSRQDFSVILYSNNPNKDSRFFDIQFSKLFKFAEKRYLYLKELMRQIDAIVLSYNEEQKKIPIGRGDDVLERIRLLIEENKRRLDNDYYDYELRKIQIIFENDCFKDPQNKAIVDKYKAALLPELDEIQSNLQNMIQDELHTKIDAKYPYEYHYAFSKLSDSVWGDGYAYQMIDWIVERLNQCVGQIVHIDAAMTLEEIYVLFLAANYIKNRND